MWKWKTKLILLTIFSFALMPFCLQGRLASGFYFFDRQVNRKYYPEEFKTRILPNTALPFFYQKINPYFFSYQGSPSLSGLKVYLTKEEVFDHRNEKTLPEPQDMILATYQRQDYQKGAFEIFTRSMLPRFTKTLSFWIFDYESGHESFIYIKTQKRLKRYSLGRIEHRGWKNFTVSLDVFDAEEEPELEKIKFFNRKGRGGANDQDPLIKIAQIEAFSISLPSRDLYPFFTLLNEKDFMWQEEKPKESGQNGAFFMRLQKGRLWDQTSVISLFITLKNPVYLELYGNQGKTRPRFFALQTPYLLHEGRYRLDIRLPKELDQSENPRESEAFFWGIGVFPMTEKNPELKLEQVMIWPEIKTP